MNFCFNFAFNVLFTSSLFWLWGFFLCKKPGEMIFGFVCIPLFCLFPSSHKWLMVYINHLLTNHHFTVTMTYITLGLTLWDFYYWKSIAELVYVFSSPNNWIFSKKTCMNLRITEFVNQEGSHGYTRPTPVDTSGSPGPKNFSKVTKLPSEKPAYLHIWNLPVEQNVIFML